MKGMSLLETIVVVAIIAILSPIGVNTINNYRLDKTLDNIANELTSDIRLTRNKSINGELLGNEDINIFDEEGLPEYGINLSENEYFLVRKCLKIDGSNCTTETPIENIKINTNYVIISPEMSFYFDRITGYTDPKEIVIKEKDGTNARKINISANQVISITKYTE